MVGALFSARFGKFAGVVDFSGEDAVGRVRGDEFRWVGMDCGIMLNLWG